jgi:membrane protein implicated in regulation of membrane protease activity
LTEASGVNDIGKTLVVLGLLIALAGLVLVFVGRVPWIGRLPGDIHVQRGNWSFYFPLGTSILLSLLLTLLFWLFGRR